MSAHHTNFWRSSAAQAASVACLLLLTACGGSSGDGGSSGGKAGGDEVASLPSSGAPSAPTSKGGGGSKHTDASSGRPQMRLDMTADETHAMIAAWDACLVKNGARYAEPGTQPGVAGDTKIVAEPIPQSAKSACMNKLPLSAPELDPEKNPHYRDDSVANVKCLRDHGMKVHLTEDNSAGSNALSWTYDDNAGAGVSEDQEKQIVHDCEMAAFGGKK